MARMSVILEVEERDGQVRLEVRKWTPEGPGPRLWAVPVGSVMKGDDAAYLLADLALLVAADFEAAAAALLEKAAEAAKRA